MVNVCNNIFVLINVSAYSRRVNPDTDTHDDTEEEELSDNDLIIKDNLFYEAVRCDVMKWKLSMANLMLMQICLSNMQYLLWCRFKNLQRN